MKEEQVGFFLDIECDLENILNDRVEGGDVVEVDVPGVEDLGLGLLEAGEEQGELILSCSSRDAGGWEEIRLPGECRGRHI